MCPIPLLGNLNPITNGLQSRTDMLIGVQEVVALRCALTSRPKATWAVSRGVVQLQTSLWGSLPRDEVAHSLSREAQLRVHEVSR